MTQDCNKIRPALVDIRCKITAAIAFAHMYAQSNPAHALEIHHFSQELAQIVNELGEAVYGGLRADEVR